ncbi:SH3 domain-containing protein [Hyalangium versicolor]|uniref:SH3 domain-containing protein n=1 Tax=Hyalangium versicolor TaxID=2861190 RepID=UPI001CCCAAB0|nr:SH3 domain-containing protein [Hyalangium versicolor]
MFTPILARQQSHSTLSIPSLAQALLPGPRGLILGVLLVLLQVAPAFAEAPAQSEKQRIAAASGIRLRATPAPSGKEVTKLFIGTVLKVLEQTAKQETIGGKADYWYRVATPEGQEGWVFGSLVWPLLPDQQVQTYLEIARQRMADEKTPFVDRADLVNFLKATVTQTPAKESAAHLELALWRAMRWTLAALSEGNVPKSAYEKWVQRQGDALVYSEPAGEWFVSGAFLWKLEEKYRGLPEAEALAWEAATTTPPGECEGYAPCYLAMSNSMEGEYLRRYPAGPHAGEALKALQQGLGTDGISDLDQEGRTDLREELGKLEAALGPVKLPEKKKALDQLQALRKAAGK